MIRRLTWRTSARMATLLCFAAAMFMTLPSAGAQLAVSPPVHPLAPTSSQVSLGLDQETGAVLGGSFVGPADLGETASVVITLPLMNAGALSTFDVEVSTPGTPEYLHFLDPAQIEAQYAPPSSVRASIEDWLEGAGLEISYVAPDGLSIDAAGTLSQMQSAFGTGFSNYRSSTGSFWAADTSPSVPASLAPWIQSVAGLTDQPSEMTTLAQREPSVSSPDALYEGTGGVDTPDQNHQILQLDQLYNATGNSTKGSVPTYAYGTKIAQDLWSYETDCGYSTTDLGTFFTSRDGYPTGLPAITIVPNYDIGADDGNAPGTGDCGGATTCADCSAPELTLDQEYSGTDAPGATLEPTWADGATNGDLEQVLSYAVNDIPGLDTITQSFGGGETTNTTGSFEQVYEADYDTATAEGISLFASSADSDGADGGTCAAPTDPGVEYPGSSPHVISVGAMANNNTGDSTYEDLNGANPWNWCGGYDILAGSTGGVSEAFAKPWYQVSYAVNSSIANAVTYYKAHHGTVYAGGTPRGVPDWAGPGSNMEPYYDGAWQSGYGGTSFSSPATAGMLTTIMVFDGHKLGWATPLLYTYENEYLKHVPGILRPTYSVNNGSNAFFLGEQTYNTSAGWGVPMALNLSEDLGKPFIATNPESEPETGSAYAITATVKDVQDVSDVNVAYLVPGGTGADWANLSLTMSSGTATDGTWTGSIPASALTTAGDLKYCVYATDVNDGNSWSPYNMSAWAATENPSPTNGFGCTVPFVTYVLAVTPVLKAGLTNLNYTDAKCELTCAVELNATFNSGTGPYHATVVWSGTAHALSGALTGSPARFFYNYTTAGTYTITVYVDDSMAQNVSESTSLTVYPHIEVASLVPNVWHGPSPLNETGYTPSFTGGPSGTGPIAQYAWRLGNGVTSTSASSPDSVFYLSGTYTTTLNVTDLLGYRASGTVSLIVSGSPFAITLYAGWNFVAIPFDPCTSCTPAYHPAFSLYNLAEIVGYPNLVTLQDVRGTTTTTYSQNGAFAVDPGDALWVDVQTAETITLYGNTSANALAGLAYTASTWSSVGWSLSSSTTAATLAGLLTGAEAISTWDAQTQTWVTFEVYFSDPSEYDFTIADGQAVEVFAASSGTFSE